MTTIATDGKVVVADGLTTSNGHILSRTSVKIHRIGDEIVGCCGASDDCAAYIEALKKGEDLPDIERGEFNALHVSKRGAYLVSGGNMKRTKLILPTAIGHGSEIAEGAMLAGASLMLAVKLACSRTTVSGGKLRSLTVDF